MTKHGNHSQIPHLFVLELVGTTPNNTSLIQTMTYLAAPLLFAIALLSLFGDSQAVFLFADLIGAFAGLYGLGLLLVRPRLIRFSSLMALSLLLGYALSTALYATCSASYRVLPGSPSVP